jgi:hypothetical protein
MKDLKTIDVNAKEWFDKANGNSYFSGTITLNFGMDDAEQMEMPFQYGYGDHYVDMAKCQMTEHNKISPKLMQPLWRYCEENDIILRNNIQRDCLKRDVV